MPRVTIDPSTIKNGKVSIKGNVFDVLKPGDKPLWQGCGFINKNLEYVHWHAWIPVYGPNEDGNYIIFDQLNGLYTIGCEFINENDELEILPQYGPDDRDKFEELTYDEKTKIYHGKTIYNELIDFSIKNKAYIVLPKIVRE